MDGRDGDRSAPMVGLSRVRVRPGDHAVPEERGCHKLVAALHQTGGAALASALRGRG